MLLMIMPSGSLSPQISPIRNSDIQHYYCWEPVGGDYHPILVVFGGILFEVLDMRCMEQNMGSISIECPGANKRTAASLTLPTRNRTTIYCAKLAPTMPGSPEHVRALVAHLTRVRQRPEDLGTG